MPGSGVHARIAVQPVSGCVLRQLSEDRSVRRVTPGDPGTAAPQLVATTPDEAAFDDTPCIEEIVRFDDVGVFRLPCAGPDAPDRSRCEPADDSGAVRACTLACEECGDNCLAMGFDFLPVAPYDHDWRDGRLYLSIATTDKADLLATIETLRASNFVVSLQQLSLGEAADAGPTTLFDVGALTPRQREVATVATRMGYFDPDGASAEEVAAELDIATSTLSDHLRAVISELFEQAFASR